MNPQGGWVKLWRKTLESPIWKNPDLMRVWTWCLLKANYTESGDMVRYREVSLRPGQFLTGRHRAARETGLSEQTLRTCLSALESNHQIIRKSTNKYSIITIVNWDTYQGCEAPINQQLTSKVTSNQPASNHSLKERQEGEELCNPPPPPTPARVREAEPPPDPDHAAAAEPSDSGKAEATERARKFLDAFPEVKRRGIREPVVVENLASRNGEGEAWLAALLAAIRDDTVRHPLAAADARIQRGEAVPRKEANAVARLFAKGGAAAKAVDETIRREEEQRNAAAAAKFAGEMRRRVAGIREPDYSGIVLGEKV
jgi:hypothetical protein